MVAEEDVRIDGTQALSLHHLYRAMDLLEAQREAIEEALYFRLADLLNLDVELVFYDTTSLHFEVDEADVGGKRGEVHGSVAAGRKTYRALRQRGHAKNGRSDVPQIVIGLAVTRDGFPVRHLGLPRQHRRRDDGGQGEGGPARLAAGPLRVRRRRRHGVEGEPGDARPGGGKYIVAMPVHRGGDVAVEVLTRPGRYQQVADNLAVKEVIVGDGERRRRYVVCHNPQEAERQSRSTASRSWPSSPPRLSRSPARPGTHGKRVCELRASGRYGQYLRFTRPANRGSTAPRVAAVAKLDGKFVVHSNDDTLTAEDLALGYKQLSASSRRGGQLKSGLRMRPVFHWAPHRIHAHVSITVLALLLERVAEHACGDTWRNIRDDLKPMKLAQLSSANGTVWQVTEPSPDTTKRLKALQIPKPPPILDLA